MIPVEQVEEQLLIEGTVDAVIYQNEENGYTVLRIDAGEQGGITVVGCMPAVAPGESLSVQGRWMRHASYGEQFKAEIIQRRMPAGEKAIFEYLASGAVKGIGAATARRMVEEFGEDALTVLEEQPERLTQIKGITRKRALAMGEAFRLQMGMRRLLDFLGEHGVALQLAMPLYRRYGDRALEVIRGNPYLLVDEELGVEFALADQLALEMGNAKVLNVIMLGVYVGYTEVIDPAIVWQTIEHKLSSKPKLLPLNKQAFEKGLELGRAQNQ